MLNFPGGYSPVKQQGQEKPNIFWCYDTYNYKILIDNIQSTNCYGWISSWLIYQFNHSYAMNWIDKYSIQTQFLNLYIQKKSESDFFVLLPFNSNPPKNIKNGKATSKHRRRSIHMAGLNLGVFGRWPARNPPKEKHHRNDWCLRFIFYFSVWKLKSLPFFGFVVEDLLFDTTYGQFSAKRRKRLMISKKSNPQVLTSHSNSACKSFGVFSTPNLGGSISCQFQSWPSQFDDSPKKNEHAP